MTRRLRPACYHGARVRRNRRAVASLAAIAAIAAAPLACRSMLYHPTSVDAAALASRDGWTVERIASGEVTLVGLTRPAGDPDARWILLFGGNAMSLASSQRLLERLAGEERWGLAAWAYRGYDGSGGRPTERGLVADARAASEHLAARHGVEPRRLGVVGYSLGTGVAVALAASLAEEGRPPARLLLLAPYRSIDRLAHRVLPILPGSWLAPDHFRSERRLPGLAGPILVVHGARDTVIPVEHGRAIAAALGERARYLELAERGHEDLLRDEAAVAAMRAFLGETN